MEPSLTVGQISMVAQVVIHKHKAASKPLLRVSAVLPVASHIVKHSVMPPVCMNHLSYICTLSLIRVGRGTSGEKSLTRGTEYTDWVTWKPAFLVPVASLIKQQE